MQLFKPFAILWALLLSSAGTFASHNVSARLEYETNSGNTFTIRFVTFTDPSAAQVDRCSIDLEIWNSAGTLKIADITNVPRINGPLTDPNFPITCPGNIPMGEYVTPTIKRNVYEVTYTFPGPGYYQIFAWDVSRIDNMINMSNSGSTPVFVRANILVNSLTGANRSPVINNDTVLTACTQQPWFNQLDITDADGDSLSFELVPCMQYNPPSIPSPIVVTGYGFPGNVGGGYFWVGPLGNVLWQNASNMLGSYAYALKITEWRDGIQIGLLTYDATVFVLPNNCFVSADLPWKSPGITAFPNPADGFISVEKRVELLQLYDLQGHLLREGFDTDHLQVDGIAAGIYLLRISQNGTVSNSRIVIAQK
jgi:hypothetical protein